LDADLLDPVWDVRLALGASAAGCLGALWHRVFAADEAVPPM
jgi:hypothetical protein